MFPTAERASLLRFSQLNCNLF